MIVKKYTNSADETKELGFTVGKLLQPPAVVLLDGDLAAGKTTFTQGLSKAIGVNKVVNSPSYTIMKQYEGFSTNLYHLDLYRLENVGYDFDLEEYLEDGIAVIEWPFRVEELLPDEYLLIKINKVEDNKREFIISSVGPKYKGVVKCID